MKKVVIVIALLLLLPSVFATVSFNPLGQSMFNLGDTVALSGYVYRDASFDGFLELRSVCDGKILDFPKIPVSLNAGQKKYFPDELKIPKVTISNAMVGLCRIEGSLIQNNAVVESSTSTSFEVSKDLNGNFGISENKIQVGDTLRLTGNIFKLNGKGTTGSAEVYFSSNESKFLVDVASFTEGALTYDYVGTRIPSGEYQIDLIVNDVFGNRKEFAKVASFTLVSDMYVIARPDKTQVDPGEKVEISGEAHAVLQDSVTDGKVFITIDEQSFTTELKDGKFAYDVPLTSDVKSGKHVVQVRVEDDLGNEGTITTEFFVNPKVMSLELSISPETVSPGSSVEIIPSVFDQAHDVVLQDVTIKVLNADDKVIREDVVKTGSSITIPLDVAAVPGSYHVRADVGSLKKESMFTVSTSSVLSIVLQDQSLIVKNTGNIKYDKPIKVSFNSDDVVFVKKSSLDPGQQVIIPLTTEVETGMYDVVVSSGDVSESFKNISIVGVERTNMTIIYWILAILVLGLMVLAAFWTPLHEERKRRFRERERKRAMHDMRVLREQKENRPRESRFSAHRMDRDEMVRDYRSQMVKQVKEAEETMKDRESRMKNVGSRYMERRSEEGFERKKDDLPEDKKGMFRIFE